MKHGCKCDCFWCKVGKALGLVAEADDVECCSPAKKSVGKKKTTKRAKK